MTRNFRSLAVAIVLSAGCSAMVNPEKNDPLKDAEGFCNSVQDTLDRLGCNLYDSWAPGIAPAALDLQLTALRRNCDSLQALVDAGHFAYDEGIAEDCLSALEARGCRSIHLAYYGAWPLACTNALKGNVAPGGSCTYADTGPVQQGSYNVTLNECTQGSTCLTNDLATCGGGVCGFRSNVLESCAGNHECQPYLYCDYNGGYVCRQYAGSGAACTTSTLCDPDYYYCSGGSCAALPSAGQTCAPGSKCRVGNWCNYNTNVCTAYVGYNATCNYSSGLICATGLFCATDSKCRYYNGEGGSCASPDQCGSSGSISLYCDESSICRRYPSAPMAQGASCYNLGTAFCADGLFCDTTGAVGAANTCQPKVGGGALCPTYEMCADGYTCQYDPTIAGNACRRLKGLGESCASISYDYCQPGLWCDEMGSDTCKLPGGAGQPCANGGMQPCGPGTYPDYATTCTCRAFFGEGAACTSSYECGEFQTGRRCLTSGGPTSTCQTLSCRVPAGWLAGGSGGGY